MTAHIYKSSTSDQKASESNNAHSNLWVGSQKGIPWPLLPPATPGALHFPGAQMKNGDHAHDFNFPLKVKIPRAKHFVHSWRNKSLSLVVHRAPIWSFCQEQGDADRLAALHTEDMQDTEGKTQILPKFVKWGKQPQSRQDPKVIFPVRCIIAISGCFVVLLFHCFCSLKQPEHFLILPIFLSHLLFSALLCQSCLYNSLVYQGVIINQLSKSSTNTFSEVPSLKWKKKLCSQGFNWHYWVTK